MEKSGPMKSDFLSKTVEEFYHVDQPVSYTHLLLIRLSRHKKFVKLNWKGWKVDLPMFQTITRIGVPAGIEKLGMRLGQLVYNGMIISLGTSAYVAHSVAGTIESYTYIPAMGFGAVSYTHLDVYKRQQFIPSIANTVGTDFTKYKVVRKGQFTYIPDTSRRGCLLYTSRTTCRFGISFDGLAA